MMLENKSFDFEVRPCDRKSGSWVEKLFAYVFNLSKVETSPWADLQVNDLGNMITLGLSLNLNGEVLLYKPKEWCTSF